MELFQDSQTWVAISFLVFILILWRYGKNAVLGALDKKIEAIKTEIETAESLRVEAQELLAQYQRKQRDAAKESESIVANAKQHAEMIKKETEKELKDIAKRREQQLKERLSRMEQNAMNDIQAYAAELAVKATSEIIAKQMDKKTNENLVESSIKDVSKKLGS